jgi:glycosyltransferase involved in cell wall biosynthesis
MRVIHVITRLIVGGAQENTIATVLGLIKKGIQTELISGPTFGAEGSLESNFDSFPEALKILPSLVRPVSPWQDIRATFALMEMFRQSKPTIVHTHSGKGGFVGRLAARKARVPIVIHTIHGPSFGPAMAPMADFAFTMAERYVGKFTDHFVSVADAMTRQYLAAGIGNPQEYTRIFSGFPLEPFLAVPPRSGAGDFVIGKIARLFNLKGHIDLIKAAPEIIRAIPNAKFLLIGDGPLREYFEARATSAGLRGRFVFTGLVPPSEIPNRLAECDMVVHLSLREGLPRALSQALAAGRPVVAYDCDGASEICLHEKTGFLVPPGDTKAFANRVIQLARDPQLRNQFAQTGRQYVRENFSEQKMVDEIYQLYQRLLPQAQSR